MAGRILRDWAPDLLTGWTMIACGLAGWCAPPAEPVRRAAGGGGVRLVRAQLRRDRGGRARLAQRACAVPVSGPARPAGAHLSDGAGPAAPGSRRGRRSAMRPRSSRRSGQTRPPRSCWRACSSRSPSAVTSAPRAASAACGWPRCRRRRCLRRCLWRSRWSGSPAPAQAASAATLHAYQAGAVRLVGSACWSGLLRWPWERAEVADLVVELGEARSGTLRDELARALGDPSLQVGYWVPESAGFVDSGGRPVRVPDPGSGRSA